MVCPDCKGEKTYIPLIGPPETCQTCKGKGDVPDSSDEFKRDALDLCQEDRSRFKTVFPKVGDTIHVYDNEWLMFEVDEVDQKAVWGYHKGSRARVQLLNIAWNDTPKRWEFIYKGTPV